MGFSEAQVLALRYTSVSICSLSIIGALFIIFTFLFYVLPRKRHNKLATRLIFFVSFNDVFFHVAQIANMSYTSYSPACEFTMWMWVFSCLGSTFFMMAIAFNLQEVFLRNPKKRLSSCTIEIISHVFAWTIATIVSFLPFAQRMYGWDSSQSVCWFKYAGTPKSIIWQVTSVFFWITIALVYCLVIFSCVAIKIVRLMYTTKAPVAGVTKDTAKIESVVVARLVFYPLVYVISQLFNFVNEFYNFGSGGGSTNLNFVLFMLNVATIASQGLLNALVFSFDASIRQPREWLLAKLWCCKRKDHSSSGKKAYLIMMHDSSSATITTAPSSTIAERLLQPEQDLQEVITTTT